MVFVPVHQDYKCNLVIPLEKQKKTGRVKYSHPVFFGSLCGKNHCPEVGKPQIRIEPSLPVEKILVPSVFLKRLTTVLVCA
jgi:hypothetical protein